MSTTVILFALFWGRGYGTTPNAITQPMYSMEQCTETLEKIKDWKGFKNGLCVSDFSNKPVTIIEKG